MKGKQKSCDPDLPDKANIRAAYWFNEDCAVQKSTQTQKNLGTTLENYPLEFNDQ